MGFFQVEQCIYNWKGSKELHFPAKEQGSEIDHC